MHLSTYYEALDVLSLLLLLQDQVVQLEANFTELYMHSIWT